MDPPVSVARGVARGFLSISVGNLVSRGISFFALLYLARTLGPEAFGAVGWAQAALVFGTITGDLGLQTLGVRVAAQEPEHAPDVLSNYVSLRFLLSAASVALLAGFALVSGQSTTVKHLTILFGLTLLAAGLTTEWLFIGLQRMELVGLSRILQSASYAALLLAFVRRVEDIFLVPLATGASLLVSAGVLLYAFQRSHRGFRFQPSPSTWPALLRTALPLGLTDALVQVYVSLPILIIGWSWGETTTGYYNAAFRVVQVLNELLSLLFISFYPIVAFRWKHAPETIRPLLANVMKLMLVITLPIAAGALVSGRQVLTVFLGPRFAGSILPFQILVWNLVPAAIGGVYKLLVLLMNGRQKEYLVVVGAGAAAGLVLNIALVPGLGCNGAAVARIGSEIAVAVVGAVIARRYVSVALWRTFARVTVGTLIVAVAGGGLVAAGVSVWTALATGAVAYVPTLLLIGGISRAEIGFLARVVCGRAPHPTTAA